MCIISLKSGRKLGKQIAIYYFYYYLIKLEKFKNTEILQYNYFIIFIYIDFLRSIFYCELWKDNSTSHSTSDYIFV